MARIASDWLVLCAEPLIKSRRDEFGDYLFDIGTIRLVRIADVQRTKSDEVSGYIEVQSGNAHIYQSRINLLSSSQQDTLCRTLKRRDNFSGWEAVMHLCFLHVVKSESAIKDFVLIDEVEPESAITYAVDPILMDGRLTVLAGDGGCGKSFFSLALGMVIISGTELVSGLKPGRMGPVLYLDWEDSAGEISYRYHALKRGFGSDVGQGLYYHRMTAPIHMVKQDLARLVRRYEPELIIVDSLSMAAGAEPEKADSAIRVFDTVRGLNCTSLVISHIAKSEQASKRPSPYGSIQVVNQARSVWIQKRIESEQEESEIVFTLTNTKTNRGPKNRFMGFRLRFESDAVRLTRIHSSDPALLENMTLAQQIRAVLTRPMSVQEIADELDANANGVKSALYRMRRKGQVSYSDSGWSLTARN